MPIKYDIYFELFSATKELNYRFIGLVGRQRERLVKADFVSDEQLHAQFQGDEILQALIHPSVAHNTVADETRYRGPKSMIQDKYWPLRVINHIGEKDWTFIVGTRSIAVS
uniref:Uncharacterized protein n=1 Tax=Panagrolaimus superbus TaxID=310955 RepID=A0A914Z0L4_9BILA